MGGAEAHSHTPRFRGGRPYIVNRTWLTGTLDNLHEPPALRLREWAGLLDAHGIAGVGVVRLVVRVQLGRLLDELAVDGVLHLPLDGDSDGLVHLVGHDQPHAD